jgi:hypothetical protein
MPTYESLPIESRCFNGSLFPKMAEDLRLAGKAKRTVYGYLRATGHLVTGSHLANKLKAA